MVSPLLADGPRRTSPAVEDEWVVEDDGTATWTRSARFIAGDPDDDFPPYVDATWTFWRTVIDPAKSRMANAVNRAVIAHIAATFAQMDYGEEVPVDENLPWHRVDPRGGIEESCTATFVSHEFVSFDCHRNWEAMHPEADRETIIFIPDGDGVRGVTLEALLAGAEARHELLALLEERVRRIIRDDGPESRNAGFKDEVPAVAEALLRDAWLRPGGITSLTFPSYGAAFDAELSLLEIGPYLRPDVAAALARSEPLGPIEVTLEPASTLPALPVALHFTVRTESSAVGVPARALLIVTPATGDPFVAKWGHVWTGEAPRVADLSRTVEGAAVRKTSAASFTLPVRRDLGTPEWFADPRLAVPGVYELRLLLDDELTEEVIRGCSVRDILAGVLPRAVVSRPVSLTVEEPAGPDAGAWRFLTTMYEEPSSATLSGNQFVAGELWHGYRESAYARRLAIQVPGTPEVRVAIATEMAKSFPAGPLRDEWTLTAAEREMEVYLELYFSENKALAKKHAGTAIETLSRLADTASDPAIRSRAGEILEDARECVKAPRCNWTEIRMRRFFARWDP